MKNNYLINRIRQRSLEVYQYYLGSNYPSGRVEPGKNISNPFLGRKQETPSFRVFQAYDGSYLFIDSADLDCKGDCITFLQKFKNLTRDQAIAEIKKVINLSY